MRASSARLPTFFCKSSTAGGHGIECLVDVRLDAFDRGSDAVEIGFGAIGQFVDAVPGLGQALVGELDDRFESRGDGVEAAQRFAQAFLFVLADYVADGRKDVFNLFDGAGEVGVEVAGAAPARCVRLPKACRFQRRFRRSCRPSKSRGC